MSSDINKIISILKKRGREDLAKLLIGSKGEIDESSSYGSYLFSIISQYLFYLSLDNFHEIKKIAEADRKVLLEAVLYLYPHQANAPEITGVDFRVLRNPEESELVEVESRETIDHEFVNEQLVKCEKKIADEDCDGAISTAGSLLEGVFEDIYKRCTGQKISSTADLKEAYKKVKSLIKLSDEQFSDESIKAIMRGLSAIVSGLGSISNQMGDRHSRLTKPVKRHAKLCVNSARIITDFFYETLSSQEEKTERLHKELVELLNGNRRMLRKEDLLLDEEIIKYLNKCDVFLRNAIKRYFICNFPVLNYRSSDIFFSALEVFFEQLTKDDIKDVYDKHRENSQACGLDYFLMLVKSEREQIIPSDDLKQYIQALEKRAEEKNSKLV